MSATKPRSLAESVAGFMARCAREGDCLISPQRRARYGWITFGQGLQMSAHRAVYTALKGPIPEGFVVRHACDRIGCVEPSHLSIGTPADNERDKRERGRMPVGERVHNAWPNSLVDRVRELYAAGELTKAEVAERTGLTLTTVHKWTLGQVRGLTPIKVRDGRFKGDAPCGTRAGYGRHRQGGEPACAPCRQANSEYSRAYRAAQKASP